MPKGGRYACGLGTYSTDWLIHSFTGSRTRIQNFENPVGGIQHRKANRKASSSAEQGEVYTRRTPPPPRSETKIIPITPQPLMFVMGLVEARLSRMALGCNMVVYRAWGSTCSACCDQIPRSYSLVFPQGGKTLKFYRTPAGHWIVGKPWSNRGLTSGTPPGVVMCRFMPERIKHTPLGMLCACGACAFAR